MNASLKLLRHDSKRARIHAVMLDIRPWVYMLHLLLDRNVLHSERLLSALLRPIGILWLRNSYRETWPR
jgi:hypothetical protein